jgi:hypothetical protein
MKAGDQWVILAEANFRKESPIRCFSSNRLISIWAEWIRRFLVAVTFDEYYFWSCCFLQKPQFPANLHLQLKFRHKNSRFYVFVLQLIKNPYRIFVDGLLVEIFTHNRIFFFVSKMQNTRNLWFWQKQIFNNHHAPKSTNLWRAHKTRPHRKNVCNGSNFRLDSSGYENSNLPMFLVFNHPKSGRNFVSVFLLTTPLKHRHFNSTPLDYFLTIWLKDENIPFRKIE